MSDVFWLDFQLIALGLLALSPRLWQAARRRRAAGPIRSSRGKRAATVSLFYLGLGLLATAGVDLGLAKWEKSHRSNSNDWDAALAELLNAHRLHPIDPEAIPKPEAPDFRLPALDEDRSVRLSDFRGHKPVVLIFGSFG